MRRIAIAALALTALTACGDDDEPESTGPPPAPVMEEHVETKDLHWNTFSVPVEGRPLQCVWIRVDATEDRSRFGGPSCNWEEWNDGNHERG